jgi:hypothetical protein
MAHERRFLVRRGARIVLLWVMVVAFTIALLLSGSQVIKDGRGATVDAEVVSITTNVPGRRLYDVRLVTLSGRVCVTKVVSGSNPPPREIRVGETSRVHYPAGNPCADFSARESTSQATWLILVVAPLVIASCLLSLRRLRRYRWQPSGLVAT